MREVVVVGSGISGLSVAYRLKKAGYDVVVYEKDDFIGGNIQTEEKDGYILELGPQTVLADEEVLNFLKDLGLKPVKAKPSAKYRYIYKNNKLIPFPTNPLSFLTSPLLSFKGKLKVLLEPWAKKSLKDEESIAEFVERRLGKEFLDYIVEPFISGVYAGDPEKLSAKYAIRRVYELEKNYGSIIRGAIKKKALGPKGVLISFKKGLKELINRLADELEIKKENVVLRIRRKDDKFILDTRGGKEECRYLIVSSPAYTASYLLKDLSWSASLEFDKIDYVPVVVVNIGLKKVNIPEGFGFLIPRKEGKRILGVIFASKIFPHKAPENRELITVYLGGAKDREIINLSEEEIKDIVLKELKGILGDLETEFIHIKKWKRAIPQYTLGYGKYLELAKEMEETHKGLFLTGNYLSGVSVADCIKYSKEVERRVRELAGK